MKKISIAILALIYIVVSSGIAMNINYCMGKVSSVDFYNQKLNCGKCGMKTMAAGCCRHEYKIVKLSDTHQQSSTDLNIFSPVVFIENPNNIFAGELSHSHLLLNSTDHSPPGLQGTSLCILNCVFRI